MDLLLRNRDYDGRCAAAMGGSFEDWERSREARSMVDSTSKGSKMRDRASQAGSDEAGNRGGDVRRQIKAVRVLVQWAVLGGSAVEAEGI